MLLIDYHSHILPKMDDGASSSEEALKMLLESASQGVDIIYATPHFYPDFDNPESFFAKREASFNRLKEVSKERIVPKVLLGAEVAYYYGIGKSEIVHMFCYENTKELLIEMPLYEWRQSVIEDIQNVCAEGLVPVIAHFERYLAWNSFDVIANLRQYGVKLQCNTSFLLNRKTTDLAKELYNKGFIDYIGSDMHNMQSRPQNLAEAFRMLNE